MTQQAKGDNASQTEGKYLQNRRAVETGITTYALPYDSDACKYISEWSDGQMVIGEVSNGIFYPHVKNQS